MLLLPWFLWADRLACGIRSQWQTRNLQLRPTEFPIPAIRMPGSGLKAVVAWRSLVGCRCDDSKREEIAANVAARTGSSICEVGEAKGRGNEE